jgi:hypothetical protein
MSGRRWPPAYAGRWLEHRRELATAHELGEHRHGARANLRVYLGWSGQRPAGRELNSVWLAPDRDPDHTDWACARHTIPTVIGGDADLEHVRAVGHNLVAAGCEFVLVIYRAAGAVRTAAFYP